MRSSTASGIAVQVAVVETRSYASVVQSVVNEPRRRAAIEMCSERARHKLRRRDSERRPLIGHEEASSRQAKPKTGDHSRSFAFGVARRAAKTTRHRLDGTPKDT